MREYDYAEAMRKLRDERRANRLCIWCGNKAEIIEWVQVGDFRNIIMDKQQSHQCTKCRRSKHKERKFSDASNSLYCNNGNCTNYTRVKRYRTGRGVFDATLMTQCHTCSERTRGYNQRRRA